MEPHMNIGLTFYRLYYPLYVQLITCTHKLANLGMDQYFSKRFSYPTWMILPGAVTTRPPQCERALSKMETIWTYTSGGSLLLISLSVALLQVEATDNSLWGKTLAISIFMPALAGILSSAILLVDGSSLLQESASLRWQEASRRRAAEDAQTIEFWSLLALPGVCFAWSLSFLMATIIYIATTSTVAGTLHHWGNSKFEVIVYGISVLFISILNTYFFLQVYQLKKLIRRD